MKKEYKSLITVEFILYTFILIFAIFFKSLTPDSYKIVVDQYHNIMFYYPTLWERFLSGFAIFTWREIPNQFVEWLIDAFLNLIAFMPFGALLYYLFDKKKIIRSVMISLAFSSLIEIAQLITIIGGFGMEDLITNVVGGFLGACIMALISRIHLEKKHVRAILTGIIVISAFVLVYLMHNAFIHFDAYIDIVTRNI